MGNRGETGAFFAENLPAECKSRLMSSVVIQYPKCSLRFNEHAQGYPWEKYMDLTKTPFLLLRNICSAGTHSKMTIYELNFQSRTRALDIHREGEHNVCASRQRKSAGHQ